MVPSIQTRRSKTPRSQCGGQRLHQLHQRHPVADEFATATKRNIKPMTETATFNLLNNLNPVSYSPRRQSQKDEHWVGPEHEVLRPDCGGC